LLLPRLSRRASFIAVAVAFVAVFAAAGSPIPLYNTYRAEDGVTKGHLGIVTVGYLVAAAVSLLMLGRLSNHLGRRPVALAALGLGLVACAILIAAQGPVPLFTARLLQGLSSGLASTALGAFVVDTSRDRPGWLAAAITGTGPMMGVATGALTCGALVQYAPAPKVLIFLVVMVALAVSFLLVLMSPETVARSPGVLRSTKPQLQVPRGSGRLVLTAGAAAVATWSMGGFYQAYGPAVVKSYLGTGNALVAAAVFAAMLVLTPFGGPIAARMSPATGVRTGMALFLAGLAGLVWSLEAGAIWPFVAASLVIGLAQGIASTGALRALLAMAAPHERAGLLSTLYVVSYAGAAFPGIVAFAVAANMELRDIALGYAAVALAGAIVAVTTARNPPVPA
jgi:MFS family permease